MRTPALIFLLLMALLTAWIWLRPLFRQNTGPTCRSCKHENATDARFCGRCGESFPS